MRIGIIGCGYVGMKAAAFCNHLGHDVSVTTRKAEKIESLSAVAQHVCLLNDYSFDGFIQNQEILLVCVAPGPGEDYRSTYLDTAHKISEALHHAPSLKQIIYTSSTSVYGDLNGDWVDETGCCIPENESGNILLQTEQTLLGCRSPGVKVCIFRLGEIFGPGRRIVDRLKKMVNTALPGNGEAYTNLIHIEDIVGAIDFALIHQLEGIYNLCNDVHLQRKEFYNQLCRQHHLPLFSWDPSLPRLHSGNKRVSNNKLKLAGFQFTHPDAQDAQDRQH
jgi:nucleoside-diphosphate-sugar epimerase